MRKKPKPIHLLTSFILSGAILVANSVHVAAPVHTGESSPLSLSTHTPLVGVVPLTTKAATAIARAKSNLVSTAVMAPGEQPRQQIKYTALDSGSVTTSSFNGYPNEPFLSRINGSPVVASGNPAPVVAVIDSGFALNHESLIGRWYTRSSEMGATGIESTVPNCTSRSLALNKSCNNIDNDANGYQSDWRGWDFVHAGNTPQAGQTNANAATATHGTMTAGLVAVMSPNAKIMPLQALDDDGTGYTDEVAAAVRYAADNGANIINLSLGSDTDDPYLHQQIDYAIAKGVLVVAAAGNTNCNCLSYPAAYPEVIAVGASDQNDARASFSSYGANLDLLAPGTAGDVCSTQFTAGNPTTAYSCGYSGTSFSAPIISGVAALLLQQTPTATTDDLEAALVRSAHKTAAMAGNYFTLKEGYGRVDNTTAVAILSITVPTGQLLNKTTASLSDADLRNGSAITTTCRGNPGAICVITATGPTGELITIGQQTLDTNYGGALYAWNATNFGLTPGAWTITATVIWNHQTATASQVVTITP